jgi:lysophospholipid acyltransferase (LPLAT)-like uncharacterized protein
MNDLQAARQEHSIASDEKLYSFASLDQYSFKQRLIIRIAGFSLFWLIKVIGWTLRYEVKGWENHSESEPLIYCCWHNRIPIATHFWRDRGIVVMSSRSFDSEYIARFIQRFGYGAARGSSTRGARTALVQMIRAVKSGKSAAFTVDGPRGPIYESKPGALLLAAKAGAAILPLGISMNRYWELPSWDRIQIPKPFARVFVAIGETFRVEESSDEEIDAKRMRLDEALTKLSEETDKIASE